MSEEFTQAYKVNKMLTLCGIFGPIFYTIVLFVLGLLRPGYNHVTQSMSELGEVGSLNAVLMNTFGFPLLGLFLLTFSLGLHRGVIEGKGAKIGPSLIAVSGIGLILTGVIQCDPGCIDVSLTGYLHSITAMIQLLV